MPRIPQKQRVVDPFPKGGRADTGLRSVPIDVSSAVPRATAQAGKAIAGIGDLVLRKAQQQQQEDEDNHVRKGRTLYQEGHSQFLIEEQNKIGADTFGNLERYDEHNKQIRQDLNEVAPNERAKERLNQKLDDIDLRNRYMLLGVLNKGRKYVNVENHVKSLEASKKTVLINPNNFNAELQNIEDSYNDDVTNGILDEQTADARIQQEQSELAYITLQGIINDNPTLGLALIKHKVYEEYLTADQILKLEDQGEQLQRIQEASLKQKITQNEKELKDAQENEYLELQKVLIDDPPETLEEFYKMVVNSNLEAAGNYGKRSLMTEARTIYNSRAKGEGETDMGLYTEMYAEILDPVKRINHNPLKIVSLIGKGLSVGGKGSKDPGAKELIDLYHEVQGKPPSKYVPLNMALSSLNEFRGKFAFIVPKDPNNITVGEKEDNDLIYSAIVQKVNKAFEDGEDPIEVKTKLMQPYLDNIMKSRLDWMSKFIELLEKEETKK